VVWLFGDFAQRTRERADRRKLHVRGLTFELTCGRQTA
jgi:hypothetical protein